MASTSSESEEVIVVKITVRNKERLLRNLRNDDSVVTFEVKPNVVTVEDSDQAQQTRESDSPKELATQMKLWLSSKNLTQSDLAKYLGRAKSTISDLLKTSQEVMPTGHGKALWLTMKQLLEDEEKQQELIGSNSKGKRKRGKLEAKVNKNPGQKAIRIFSIEFNQFPHFS